MTTAARAADVPETRPQRKPLGTVIWKVMTTTDHKVIGNLYFATSLFFFAIGGIMALAIRAELACCCCSRRRCSLGSPMR